MILSDRTNRLPAMTLAAILATSAAGVAFAEQAAAPAPAPEAAAATAQPAEVAPVERATPEAAAPEATAEATPTTEAATAVAVTASDVKIGAPVFAVDGSKVGEVNRVSSDASGSVSAIEVTFGEPASLTAKGFEVPAKEIVGLKDGIRLSLSADQAKTLAAEVKTRG